MMKTSKGKQDVWFPSVWCEYVLSPMINKEASLAEQNITR